MLSFTLDNNFVYRLLQNTSSRKTRDGCIIIKSLEFIDVTEKKTDSRPVLTHLCFTLTESICDVNLDNFIPYQGSFILLRNSRLIN